MRGPVPASLFPRSTPIGRMRMDYKEIMYDVADNIATITFNRPERLNAWTYTMGGEYQHALADAEAREEVRVIILTGAGRGFCAGLDMDQLTDIADGTAPVSGSSDSQDPVSHDNPTQRNFQKGVSFPPAWTYQKRGANDWVSRLLMRVLLY